MVIRCSVHTRYNRKHLFLQLKAPHSMGSYESTQNCEQSTKSPKHIQELLSLGILHLPALFLNLKDKWLLLRGLKDSIISKILLNFKVALEIGCTTSQLIQPEMCQPAKSGCWVLFFFPAATAAKIKTTTTKTGELTA